MPVVGELLLPRSCHQKRRWIANVCAAIENEGGGRVTCQKCLAVLKNKGGNCQNV